MASFELVSVSFLHICNVVVSLKQLWSSVDCWSWLLKRKRGHEDLSWPRQATPPSFLVLRTSVSSFHFPNETVREKAWQVCCPESPKQVVEETLSSVLIWKELGTKPDDVRKEMVLLCPSSVSVGQKNHHSYDTVTNRTRTRSTHFPSTGIERTNEEGCRWFSSSSCPTSFYLQRSVKSTAISFFLSHLASIAKGVMSFSWAPNNPRKMPRTVPLYWATKWPLTLFRLKLEQCIALRQNDSLLYQSNK